MTEINAVKAHHSIDEVVQRLHKELPSLESVTIHYEPDHPPYLTVVKLLKADKKTLSREFGRTSWLEIEHWNKDKELLDRKIIHNPYDTVSRGRAFRLLAYLLSLHADRIIMAPTTELDENIRQLFDALDIDLVFKKNTR